MSKPRRRRSVSSNTERELWSESMGRCMNPNCAIPLYTNGVYRGEIAHIEPHASNGGESYENLLILCANCHTEIDKNRENWSNQILRGWKLERQDSIARQFAIRFSSFQELEENVRPILRRNRQIFDNYGPDDDNSSDAGRRHLWLEFEPEIIANNRKLTLLLEANLKLLHQENQGVVEHFTTHAAEFLKTRGIESSYRSSLFPSELGAMFGLGETYCPSPAPSVAALQNLIGHLIDESRFIGLDLTPEPTLRFTDRNKTQTLDLTNRPRVQQIYFSQKLYHPQTTDVRLKDLLFVLHWLDKNGIHYTWPDITQLVSLRVAGRYNVKLCYKYHLSSADEVDLADMDDLILVNLYGWNNSNLDEGLVASTSTVGLHCLNQREFFKFIRRAV